MPRLNGAAETGNPGEITPDAGDCPSIRLLTVAELAAWLGVSKGWVYDHVTRKQPRLPCVRIGEMTRFRRAEIESFIQEHAKSNGSA